MQLTVGCSHNCCAFCSMYREKQFFVRPVEEVLADLAWCRRQYASIGRIFLADGDALIAPAEDLLRILEYIRTEIPECERVSCYASPKSVRRKTDAELCALRAANLQMVYMGLESGSDDILRRMRKGCSAAQIVEAAQRVRGAEMALSVTAISGLGGRAQWQEHAEAGPLANEGGVCRTADPDGGARHAGVSVGARRRAAAALAPRGAGGNVYVANAHRQRGQRAADEPCLKLFEPARYLEP